MNLCRGCNRDFGSVSAFDAHRVGTHAYTFSEGLKQNPPRENGRRCLDVEEMPDWHQDKFGRWRKDIPEDALSRIRETRRRAESGAVA
jgi:hypothetical protein